MEFSVKDLVGLFRMASLGKITGGLIHNINGPLQNIGLDLEMSQYILRKEAEANGGKESIIIARLKRIEEELDRLNTMIRISSCKATRQDNSLQNFNEFLEQELSFLNTNLYFKHNVETTFQLDPNPPLLNLLPKNSIVAFELLLQRVIEEIEVLKRNKLSIRTKFEKGLFNVCIEAAISDIPDAINKILKSLKLVQDNLKMPENNPDLMFMINIFHSEGVVIKTETGSPASVFTGFPIGK
ncbi:MAG: hypothetical protein JXL81_05080 [Deltaproteobacteria bacterium]|nr:hypothetical protein [Deltaproteobacteria bacterium]